ncbi:hypothetical protein D6853_06355 [Butyrivibrio sp. X503]|uniref:hypothetical protein n=1 Tax=Butyrivibrio sp. X503 TaxID=2364878 RepID=UPI000EA87711|nr:hypothetical protein [Butyrivibrio sp. X503]RKM56405.1 hypothetical protein D6853_06355 [Butyrivibrio sp. X503]
MAEVNLKKLSRAELLEMMITFSEEAEAAKKHEEELKEELEKEKQQLLKEMAEERSRMLKDFDEEKRQMRTKFNEQKVEMQAKFDKDINGLKARLTREKDELQKQVDDAMFKIENSQSLAEASIQLGGIMEAAQKSADMFVETLQKRAEAEYMEFKKELEKAKAQMNLWPKSEATQEENEKKAPKKKSSGQGRKKKSDNVDE